MRLRSLERPYIISSLKQPIHSLLTLNNTDNNLYSGKSIALGNPMTLVYGTVLGGQQVYAKNNVCGWVLVDETFLWNAEMQQNIMVCMWILRKVYQQKCNVVIFCVWICG